MKIRLLVCNNYRREFEEILSARCAKDVDLIVFEPRCSEPDPVAAKEILGALNKHTNGDILHAVGGWCLNTIESQAAKRNCTLDAMPFCFNMLISPEVSDKLVSEGAYILPPGWLDNWTGWLDKNGFDNQALAREFFADTAKKLVLLDTGLTPQVEEQFRKFSEFVGLPAETFPVNLDIMSAKVDETIFRLNCEKRCRTAEKELEANRKELASHAMALDMIQELADLDTEDGAVQKMFEIFGMLFAPGKMTFASIKNNTPSRVWSFPADDAAVNRAPIKQKDIVSSGAEWEKFDGGFSISVRHGGKETGILMVEDVAMPDYVDVYLNTALAMTKVLSLSIGVATKRQERNAAIEEVRKNREWLLTTLKSIGDAVVATDSEGRILFMNPIAEALTGWNSADAKGEPSEEIFKIINETSRKTVESPVHKVLKSGQIVYLANHTLLLSKNGAETPIADSGAPIRNSRGAISGSVLVFRDVSAQKIAEAEHERLQRQLMQSQKMESIGMLAGGIAHEFNNMLSVIMGTADLLLDEMETGSEAEADVRCILDSARRSKDLTMKLLSFARKEKIEAADVQASELIDETLQMLKKTALGKVTATRAMTADPVLCVDRNQILQALLNLANNAKDAMPDGGQITIETNEVTLDEEFCDTHPEAAPGVYCSIHVSDTGLGINKTIIDRIFDPFFTTKEVGKGTGLGLSITHGIIKSHSGFLKVYSEPDKGSCFTIFLPVSGSQSARGKQAIKSSIPTGSETLLIVDDEKMLLSLSEKILSRAGYKVITAQGGAEALRIFEENNAGISLVILDMIMPDMPGGDVFRAMRKIKPDLKVILASGYSIDGQASDLISEGVMGYIQKPYTSREICEKIRLVLDNAAVTVV